MAITNTDVKKMTVLILPELLVYVNDSVERKSILNNPTANISVIAIDGSTKGIKKTSPFDRFIQVIDGDAEIEIDGVTNSLSVGQCIVLPAHLLNIIKPRPHLKMIQTIIKSGYEEQDILIENV